MSGFGLKFDYFHKILLNAFIATDGVFVGKYKEKDTPSMVSFCKALDIKPNGLTDEVSDLRRSGILTKIGRSVSGGNAYDINYDLIDPEQLIITKQEYLESHYKRSVLVEQQRLEQQSKIFEEQFAKERLIEQKAYFAKQEKDRIKALKENEKKQELLKEQKTRASRLHNSYWEWLMNNDGYRESQFFDRSNTSIKDIFEFTILLASNHTDVWFNESGNPETHQTENIGYEYYKFLVEFIRLCSELELFDTEMLPKINHLYKHVKNPPLEELSNYWNFNVNREDGKKFPLDSIRIFFYTCVIGGTWNFVHCQKIYNEKEKELQQELKRKEEESVFDAPNVYNFADYKKKIS